MTAKNKSKSIILAAMLVMSIFAGAAFTGTAAANIADDSDETIADGDSYWAGQALLFEATTAEEQTIELREGDTDDSTFLEEVKTNADGEFLFNTDELQGNYVIVDGDDNATEFEVRQQSFDVDFDVSQVNNHDDSTVEMTANSNRADYDVEVTAGDLGPVTLEDIFANHDGAITQDVDEQSIILEDYSDYENELDLDFAGVEEGDYDFEFDVVDSNANSSQSLTVGAAEDAEAAFGDTIYSAHEGDTVTFTVELDNTDSATVVIGDEDEIGYETDFQVTDGDDNGVVEVEFNTYYAGVDSVDPVQLTGDSAEDSDDSLTMGAETELSSPPLEVASYDMFVMLNNDEVDVATLNITDRSTDAASTHVIPADADIDDASDIRENATERTDVAEDDQFALKFEATGLSGWFSDEVVAATDLEKGSVYADDMGMYVEIEELNPGPNTDAEMLGLGDAELITDSEEGEFYLVFDQSDLGVDVDDEYDVTLTLDENNPYVDEEEDTETVETDLAFTERMVTLDGVDLDEDDVLYQVTKNEDEEVMISGNGTVAPGTEFDIRLRSTGQSPFLKAGSATIDSNGNFATAFDFSDVEDGAQFTTELRNYTDRVDSQVGQPAPELFGIGVNVENEDGDALDADVTVDGEPIMDGAAYENGEYTVSADADGYEAASETVTVDDADASVTLTLAEEEPEPELFGIDVNVENEDGDSLDADVTVDGEPVQDGDAYEDGEYTVSASADGYEDASDTVTVDGADASLTLTLTEEDDGEPAENGVENGTDNGGEDDSDEETPGFGIAVALVSIFGAALLAYRRQ